MLQWPWRDATSSAPHEAAPCASSIYHSLRGGQITPNSLLYASGDVKVVFAPVVFQPTWLSPAGGIGGSPDRELGPAVAALEEVMRAALQQRAAVSGLCRYSSTPSSSRKPWGLQQHAGGVCIFLLELLAYAVFHEGCDMLLHAKSEAVE